MQDNGCAVTIENARIAFGSERKSTHEKFGVNHAVGTGMDIGQVTRVRPALAHDAVIEPGRQVSACRLEVICSLAFAGLMDMDAVRSFGHAFSGDFDMHSARGGLEHGDFSPDSVAFQSAAYTVSLGGIGAAGA